jgi:hypothetical protein
MDLELLSFYEKLIENIEHTEKKNKRRFNIQELKNCAMKFV